MKKSYIRSKLSPEYQALYDICKHKQIDYALRRFLAASVISVKEELKTPGYKVDKLHQKLLNFGNNGKWSKQMIEKLERKIFQAKQPDATDLGQWVSIEIECIFPSSRRVDEFVKFCRRQGYTNYVTVKNDGSIHVNEDDEEHSEVCGVYEDSDCSCDRDNGAIGKEIVVTLKVGQWDMLNAICSNLLSLGCTVNKTCGLHVHFDCRPYNARQVTTMGKRVARCVPALKMILPKSRQHNSFCSNTINGHKRGSRYSFVNLQSYGKHSTLEIRGHSGTLDAVKMINWIRLIKVIMNKRNTEEVLSIQNLIQIFKLDNDLIDYIFNRYNKFNKVKENINVDDVETDEAYNTSDAA